MKLFLVRHGESEGNVGKRFQTATELLTTSGEQQAKKVAKRFTHVSIDRLIASPMTRAMQTAGEISAVTGLPIQEDARFAELMQPKEIQGFTHDHPEARRVQKILRKHTFDPDFHYSDEENYFDFIKRVAGGWRALEDYSAEEHVVVVAHGHVIRVLFGLIIFGTEFSPRQFELLINRVVTNNTGITMCSFTPERGWQLLTYNDHAHLLE